MNRYVERCRCGGAVYVTFDTDGRGGLVETRTRCSGARCKKRRGECRDCGARVDGVVGKTDRCARCRRAWRQLRARQRYAAMSPARRRAKLAKKKEWRDAHPEYMREHKRKEMEKIKTDPEARARYLATCRRANAKRRDRTLAYMKEKYNKYGPGKPKPTCRKCGGEVPFNGVGRPRLDCKECRP
jgi:hypothetical protein